MKKNFGIDVNGYIYFQKNVVKQSLPNIQVKHVVTHIVQITETKLSLIDTLMHAQTHEYTYINLKA